MRNYRPEHPWIAQEAAELGVPLLLARTDAIKALGFGGRAVVIVAHGPAYGRVQTGYGALRLRPGLPHVLVAPEGFEGRDPREPAWALAHELGHVSCGHLRPQVSPSRDVAEPEAWRWALGHFPVESDEELAAMIATANRSLESYGLDRLTETC